MPESEREPGFYWVRVSNPLDEPYLAYWSTMEWHVIFDTPNNCEYYHDKDITVLSPRLIPPVGEVAHAGD